MTRAVKALSISGGTEICPANANLQIKLDPDGIHSKDLCLELGLWKSKRRMLRNLSTHGLSKSLLTVRTPESTRL